METDSKAPGTINATGFKARCLHLLDHLGPAGLVVTKHGRPVARVLPYEASLSRFVGSMAGEIEVHGDLESTGLSWHAMEGAEGPGAEP